MKTKRKALLLSLCAVLLVVASVMGTMAYLTSTDEVNNTFAVGKVKIELDEAAVDENGTPIEDADRVKANSYKVFPHGTYTKDPTVTVKAGSDESFVRMKVTFTKAEGLIALCTDPEYAEDGPTGVEEAYPLIRMVKFVERNAPKWDGIIPYNMVDTEKMLAMPKYFVHDTDTLTYYFYYTDTVKALNTNVVLPTLFNEIHIPEWATGTMLDNVKGFQINVVAEAIQADGFVDADGKPDAAAAWAAFDAQQ